MNAVTVTPEPRSHPVVHVLSIRRETYEYVASVHRTAEGAEAEAKRLYRDEGLRTRIDRVELMP